MPYQVLQVSSGKVDLTRACRRSAESRSEPVISEILASTSCSPSALAERGLRRAAVLSSAAWAFMAARSSALKPTAVCSAVADLDLVAMMDSSEGVRCGGVPVCIQLRPAGLASTSVPATDSTTEGPRYR